MSNLFDETPQVFEKMHEDLEAVGRLNVAQKHDLTDDALLLQVALGNIDVMRALAIERYPDIRTRWISKQCSLERAGRVAWARQQDDFKSDYPRPHYARYSMDIINEISRLLLLGGRPYRQQVLDPMAGTMERLQCLEYMEKGNHTVWGVEFEPEWVEGYPHPRLIHGDATRLPFEDEFFDAIVVSPSYGNRDSDRTGNWWDNSDRKTYAGALGRNVSPGSLCAPFGSATYEDGHRLAWCEAIRVLKPGGSFILNVKNFIAKGKMVWVNIWHLDVLTKELGLTEPLESQVQTRGRMSGANHKNKVSTERLYMFHKNPNRRKEINERVAETYSTIKSVNYDPTA